MTCHQSINAAAPCQMAVNADRAQIMALGRAMDSTALQSGPAATIETPPTTGTCERIASRCRKLQFRSNESRKRYMAVHRALATYSTGDA